MNSAMLRNATEASNASAAAARRPAAWARMRASALPIASALVAVAGLTYNAWRNERTEANRSTRVDTLATDPGSAEGISNEIFATRRDMVAIIQRLR